MKKLIFYLLVLCCSPAILPAQAENLEDKIQREREVFYTEELQLTPEESKIFWPLYNQFKADERNLNAEYRPNKKVELLADNEVDQQINNLIELESKRFELQKNFYTKLRKVLPARKVLLFVRAEENFKRHLLNKILKRRANMQGADDQPVRPLKRRNQ